MDQLLLKNIAEDLIIEECYGHFQKVELDRHKCYHCSEFCHKYVNKAGYDIYGQKIDNHDANGELVECPVCKKSVAATRLAPHLEKCMGLGRSGRSKRYTKLPLDTEHQSSAHGGKKSEDESEASADEVIDDSTFKPKKRRKSVLESSGKISKNGS